MITRVTTSFFFAVTTSWHSLLAQASSLFLFSLCFRRGNAAPGMPALHSSRISISRARDWFFGVFFFCFFQSFTQQTTITRHTPFILSLKAVILLLILYAHVVRFSFWMFFYRSRSGCSGFQTFTTLQPVIFPIYFLTWLCAAARTNYFAERQAHCKKYDSYFHDSYSKRKNLSPTFSRNQAIWNFTRCKNLSTSDTKSCRLGKNISHLSCSMRPCVTYQVFPIYFHFCQPLCASDHANPYFFSRKMSSFF